MNFHMFVDLFTSLCLVGTALYAIRVAKERDAFKRQLEQRAATDKRWREWCEGERARLLKALSPESPARPGLAKCGTKR